MSTIWAFDLGKGSIGEAVWDEAQNKFLHVASLLIPAEFASTRAAASRRRMWRTRQAHKAREAWLDEVWKKAGLTPLIGRRVGKVDGAGQWIEPKDWKKKKGTWKLKHEGDEKLEREFAKAGDPTCYTSCLLRIKLLRGEKLEEWQIYKALHSAVQKRGYGRVPWASRDVGQKNLTEEELAKALKKQDDELAKKDPTYKAAVEAWPKFKQEVPDKQFHYPCFYDAQKMGLWNPAQPDELKERIDHDATSTRRVRFDREDVNREIAELMRQAAKQNDKLKRSFEQWKKTGWKADDPKRGDDGVFPVHASDIGEFLVYGPPGKPDELAEKDFGAYLKFRQERSLHPGSTDDWMAATGQKTPRFDNRIINDCAVFEGMKVCNVAIRYDQKNQRIYPDSLLYAEVTFLMKLKNTLVEDVNGQRKLTVEEIRKIIAVVSKEAQAVKHDLKRWSEAVAKRYALIQRDWGNKKGIKEMNLRPLKGHEEVKAPKTEGRSRYSRPALKVIKALLLSGQKPSLFLKRLEDREPLLLDEIGMDVHDADPVKIINGNKQKCALPRPYILTKHLKFLRDLAQTSDTWEGIYIPEQRLDALEARHRDDDGQVNRLAAIQELIGSNNDPIVRHRLSTFAERLMALEEAYGVPSEIVLEFVRTDFMGDDAKRDLAKFQKDREKARLEARKLVLDYGYQDTFAPLKYELLKQQGDDCLYCGKAISMDELDQCEIDHIVPRSERHRGPDAMVNYVLACHECNQLKRDQTPYEYKHGKPGWDAYAERVNKHAATLRNKKIQLLLREDAPLLVDKYTALAETAWISRLAKKLASLHFGWKNGVDEKGVLRVTVVSGGLTGRIRRKYKLNGILDVNAVTEEEAEKNRTDKRHHALDAMMIAFLPGWMRDEKKQKFFRFPDPVAANPRAFFDAEIKRIMPENMAGEKAVLAETIYGSRQDQPGMVIVRRALVRDLAYKPATQQGKVEFDCDYALKQFKSIRDKAIRERLTAFMNKKTTAAQWDEFCKEFRVVRPDGSAGARILRVRMTVGAADEYRDMSKDQGGAWRKAKKGHKGQIIFIGEDGKPAVRPVYVFESEAAVMRELKQAGANEGVEIG
jgi:CRISPR-associated endonuclease Csn1